MPRAASKDGIQVGEEVFLAIGRNRLRGSVVEDRGNLGLNGARVLRVEISQGIGVTPSVYEVPEGELERAS